VGGAWFAAVAISQPPDIYLICLNPNVGGGLLPMAVGQLAHALTEPLLSGASPLPHWILSASKTEGTIVSGLRSWLWVIFPSLTG